MNQVDNHHQYADEDVNLIVPFLHKCGVISLIRAKDVHHGRASDHYRNEILQENTRSAVENMLLDKQSKLLLLDLKLSP